jgi:hypothetical protein
LESDPGSLSPLVRLHNERSRPPPTVTEPRVTLPRPTLAPRSPPRAPPYASPPRRGAPR